MALTAAQIDSIYAALFGPNNLPDSEQLASWESLDAAEGDDAVISGIITSPEAEQYVYPIVQVIQLVSGAVPTAQQLQSWVEYLESGGSLTDVVTAFAEGTTFANNFNGGVSVDLNAPVTFQIMQNILLEALDTLPSEAQLQAWVATGLTPVQILAEFALGDQYSATTQPFIQAYLTNVAQEAAGLPSAIFSSGSLFAVGPSGSFVAPQIESVYEAVTGLPIADSSVISSLSALDLTQCDAATIAAIVDSAEAQQFVYPVVQIIQLVTGQVPNQQQIDAWSQYLRGHGSLSNVVAAFAQGTFFQDNFNNGNPVNVNGPADTIEMTNIIANALFQGNVSDVSSSTVNAWVNVSQSTGLSIADILSLFALGDQYSALTQPYIQQFLWDVAENALGCSIGNAGDTSSAGIESTMDGGCTVPPFPSGSLFKVSKLAWTEGNLSVAFQAGLSNVAGDIATIGTPLNTAITTAPAKILAAQAAGMFNDAMLVHANVILRAFENVLAGYQLTGTAPKNLSDFLISVGSSIFAGALGIPGGGAVVNVMKTAFATFEESFIAGALFPPPLSAAEMFVNTLNATLTGLTASLTIGQGATVDDTAGTSNIGQTNVPLATPGMTINVTEVTTSSAYKDVTDAVASAPTVAAALNLAVTQLTTAGVAFFTYHGDTYIVAAHAGGESGISAADAVIHLPSVELSLTNIGGLLTLVNPSSVISQMLTQQPFTVTDVNGNGEANLTADPIVAGLTTLVGFTNVELLSLGSGSVPNAVDGFSVTNSASGNYVSLVITGTLTLAIEKGYLPNPTEALQVASTSAWIYDDSTDYLSINGTVEAWGINAFSSGGLLMSGADLTVGGLNTGDTIVGAMQSVIGMNRLVGSLGNDTLVGGTTADQIVTMGGADSITLQVTHQAGSIIALESTIAPDGVPNAAADGLLVSLGGTTLDTITTVATNVEQVSKWDALTQAYDLGINAAAGDELALQGWWGIAPGSSPGDLTASPTFGTSLDQSTVTNFITGQGGDQIWISPNAWIHAGPGAYGLETAAGTTSVANGDATQIEVLSSGQTIGQGSNKLANITELTGASFANAAALATALQSDSFHLTFAGSQGPVGGGFDELFLYQDGNGNSHLADVNFIINSANATDVGKDFTIHVSDMIEIIGVALSALQASNFQFANL